IAINVAIVISILVPNMREFSCEVLKTFITHHLQEVGRGEGNRQPTESRSDLGSGLNSLTRRDLPSEATDGTVAVYRSGGAR
ncbi:MAG: hypothetical protein DWI00_14745, partial [Planctomycetota bacterium]